MIRTLIVPDYYREFHCIGSSCPDTCCGGWKIPIDEKTMKKYHALGRSGFDFHGAVDRRRRQIVMKDGSCPLLEKGLCRLHRDLGEDYLCRACRLYPRHDEDYGSVHERSLSLSCPEAARLILKREGRLTFREYMGRGEKEAEDPASRPLFAQLMRARKQMLSMLSFRERPLAHRLAMILAMSHDMQRGISQGKDESLHMIMDRYTLLETEKGYEWFLSKTSSCMGRREERYDQMAACLGLLGELTEIYPGYGRMVSGWLDVLYRTEAGFADYDRAVRESEGEPEIEIMLENLAAYILWLYVPGAVYDRDVYTKVKYCLFSVLCIREALTAEMALGRLKKENAMGREEAEAVLLRLSWSYSRQTEHSDENLELIENALKKRKLFSMKSIFINLFG